MEFKPIYTTYNSVKIRLVNKVQFQADPKNLQEGELPDDLLGQLIVDAETAVEQDLRGRYQVPFQSIIYGCYDKLPDHSKRAIRTAVDQKAVMFILMTDFGRGTHIDATKYYENLEKSYDAYINKLMGRDPEGANDKHDRFRFSPPLDDMALALSNREADDGYKGMLINTDASHTDAVTYAEHQSNDPSKSYIARRLTNPAGSWVAQVLK